MIRVDPLTACIPNRKWRWGYVSHLFDDQGDLDALHDFARKLGLKRSWFQPHSRLDHYDLTPGMRRKALRMGAREASPKETVKAMKGACPDG